MDSSSKQNQGISLGPQEQKGLKRLKFLKEEGFKTKLGLILIGLILAGTGFLLWGNRKISSSSGQVVVDKGEFENLKSEVKSLNAQLDELNRKVVGVPSSTSQSVVTETKGSVAGAKTEEPLPVASPTQQDAVKSGKININTASVSQLDSLPSIGETYAGRIIDYRSSRGGFKSIEEIKNVKGIGDKTFEKIRDLITI